MDGRWGLGSLGSDKEQGEEGQHASSCFRQDRKVHRKRKDETEDHYEEVGAGDVIRN